MKKPLLALAAVSALAAGLAVGARGAEAPGAAAGGKVTVTGQGVVLSEPDTVEWSFGVTVAADSAATALARASTAANRVAAALRAAGIAQQDLRTEHVTLAPQHDETGRPTDRFTASSSVRAVVRDLARSGRAIDAAVDAGANTLWGPTFGESSRERLYREALRAAYANARASAQALAEASGVTLGRVLEVQEAGGGVPVPVESAVAGGDVAETKIEPGRSSTYAAVTITFATS